MDKLGDYLKKARVRQGLSLKDVYKETGISDSRLSRIENGTKAFEVGPFCTKALAKLYKINLVDLLIKAGYLDTDALSSYEQVFQNVDLLSDDERNHIQKQIDLFIKGRTKI
ncbi:helix-turn-helix domain-containing protein [Anaerotignum lactatifermentans]|uniref:helix-turn-helix domain-containing protein n=1 Tax=Anaerotignum lactatifermentans TaxID=160404 RepID=UPI0018765C0C|nr:helix-turn-helix transcriptional regulator [Anaerotignum lactatifermentans]MBE5077794.1 helix-turn-helix domain-containing protein [Anaerotignum lactatifermentans]